IILHASLDGDRFLVWGEAPAEAVVTGRGRRPRVVKPRPTPLDPGPDRLPAALAETLPAVPPLEPGQAPAWLPTGAGRPVPSSPLLGEGPEPDTDVSLAAWHVTALLADPPMVIDLLAACVGRETLATGVVVGASLAYWAQALRFAGALVAREQFIP